MLTEKELEAIRERDMTTGLAHDSHAVLDRQRLLDHIDRQAQIIDAYKRGTDNLYVAGRKDIDVLTAALAAERALAEYMASSLSAIIVAIFEYDPDVESAATLAARLGELAAVGLDQFRVARQAGA